MVERAQMLDMSRVIIFTGKMKTMERFYLGVLGLPVIARESGWVEFAAGGCTIALHKWSGRASEGPIKLVFYAADVESERQKLIAKGAAPGKTVQFGELLLWDTVDPDGNAVQVSNRKRSTAPGG
jgi:catechol-2,3-dioxygenase